MTFMVACGNCGGEGGWEIVTAPTSKWGDPTPGGEWVECPTCHGSCWLDSDEPEPEITLTAWNKYRPDDLTDDELAEYVIQSRGILIP